jgi:hypothetical protein
MSTKNLTAVTNELIESYGNTAKNVINAYRVGNERAVDFVSKGFVTAVEKAGANLSVELQDKAVSAQKSIASFYSKGVEVTSESADTAVNKVVELAVKSLEQIAANSERLEKALGANALNALVDAALPAAEAVSKVAAKLEEKSGDLVNNIAGSKAKVKVATVKRTVTKKAAAVRKAAPKAAAKVAKKVEAEVAAAA